MDFTQINLGSGVRLHICETDKFNTITCKMFIQQDLSRETAARTALIPLVLRRGSQNFPTTRQIARELEYLHSASFSADVLKIGERQIIEFYFDMVDPNLLPSGEQNAERGLETFWDIVTNPARNGAGFVEQFFSQERLSLRREVEGLVNNKRAYAMTRSLAEMCANEPFGVYKYGDTASIDALENAAEYAYYQEMLTTHPIDIFLVGPNLDVLANNFARLDIPRSDLKELRPTVRQEADEPRFHEEKMDVQQSILVMGYRTNLTYLDENYYALLVCNGILGGFPHSKLFTNVREKASLAYYVGSSIEGTKGILTINAGIDGSKVDQVTEIIEKQVDDMKNGTITQSELDQTKRGLVGSISSMSDNPASVIDRNIIGLVNGDMRSFDDVLSEIDKVTIDQVQEVAKNLALDMVYVLQGSNTAKG